MAKKWLKWYIMVKDMCLFDDATMQNCQIQGKRVENACIVFALN